MFCSMLDELWPSPAVAPPCRFRTDWSVLELGVGALLTTTILLVAAGSSWDSGVKSAASSLRWVALAALCVAAIGLARRSPGRRPVASVERRTVQLAATLVALCFASAAWSIDPRLTVERAGSVTVVLATAAAIGFSSARRPGFGRLIMLAILVAIGVLMLASIAVYPIDPSASFQAGPVRFRGIEENPDTLPLLAAYGLPLIAWIFLTSGRALERRAVAVMFVLSFVLMGATGSRGGVLAGVAGLLVVLAVAGGIHARTAVAGAIVVAVFAATPEITPLAARLPGTQHVAVVAVPAVVVTKRPPVTKNRSSITYITPVEARAYAYDPLQMDSELGRPSLPGTLSSTRNLFSSSGRIGAWLGAIRQADERPLLGYGFGTEDRVFIDRVFSFESRRPEDSWIGMYLQDGIVGVLALLALLGWAMVAGVRLLRTAPRLEQLRLAACAGVVAGGCVEMVVQSFVYSAGDIAMLSFWIGLALLAAGAGDSQALVRP
jgi:O-antigen ligase